MTLEKTIDDIIELSKIPSVTGFEQELISYLKNNLEEAGYETEITKRGMLWVKPLNGERSEHYTTAHVDRTGLISEDGRVAYSNQIAKKSWLVEDYNPGKGLISNIRKRFTDKEVLVDGTTWTVMGSDVKDDDSVYSPIEFYLDKPRVRDGPIPFAQHVERKRDIYGNEDLVGMLDNVASVGTLYTLLKEKQIKGNVLFTVDEEIGVSGDHIVDFLHSQGIEETSNLLILDTTPYDRELYRRDEVNLRQRDGRGWYDPIATARVAQACKYSDTAFRFKDILMEKTKEVKLRPDGIYTGLGLTELGKISKLTQGRINGATLQLPNLGDGVEEKVSVEGLDAFRRTLLAYHNIL